MVVVALWPLWLFVRCLWLLMRAFHGVRLLLGGTVRPMFSRLGDGIERGLESLKDGYRRSLRSGLERPSLVLMPALLLFLVAVFAMRDLGQELLPEVHQGVVLAEVRMPVGTPLARTLEIADALAERTTKIDEVDSVFVSAGVEQEVGASSDAGENTAHLTVRLHSASDPGASERRVREQMRQLATALPLPRY